MQFHKLGQLLTPIGTEACRHEGASIGKKEKKLTKGVNIAFK
jgi:hypothetical protein